jgi:large subunit ribosomal protein L24
MQATKPVKDPRKQRKLLHNAPAHLRHKLMAAPLSPQLTASKSVKTLPVRKGDTVRIMRGDNKGFEGKISRVDLRNYRIYLEGLTREKVDGTTIFLPVHPSKVMIKNLNLNDKWRKAIVERKEALAKEAAKTVEKPQKKVKKAEKAAEKPPKAAKAEEVAKEVPAAAVEEKPVKVKAKIAEAKVAVEEKPVKAKPKAKPKIKAAAKPTAKPAAASTTAKKKPAAKKQKATAPAKEKKPAVTEKKPKAAKTAKKTRTTRKTTSKEKEGGK